MGEPGEMAAPGAADQAATTLRSRGSRIPFVLAAVSGAGSGLLLSNDWCFAAVWSTVGAWFGFWLISAIIHFMWKEGSAPPVWLGVILSLAVGLMAGYPTRLRPNWAFQTAFGEDVPAGVRDLRIERHYEGGGGDFSLIMQFAASRDVVQQVTAARKFEFDDERIRAWRENGGTWERLPGTVGFFFRTWNSIEPAKKPTILYWRGTGTTARTLLVWEPDTGRAVALYLLD